MKALVVGDADDALGFAVAGVPNVICNSKRDVEAVIARSDASDTIVILSATTADMIPERLHQWRAGRGPMFVVLPAHE
jgi:vacuolar-type H+-ATPase subunit F/Vma7